jgi:hypothetical protein
MFALTRDIPSIYGRLQEGFLEEHPGVPHACKIVIAGHPLTQKLDLSLTKMLYALFCRHLRWLASIDTPRLLESCDRAQPGPSASHPDRLLQVLSQRAAASIPGSQFTDTAASQTAVRGRSRRLTPSVHTTCRVTVEPSSQSDLPSTQAVYANVPKFRSRRLFVPLSQSFSAFYVRFVYARWAPPPSP